MIPKRCPYCGKLVSGYSDEHCQKMLDIHIISKHRNMVVFKRYKENENNNKNKQD